MKESVPFFSICIPTYEMNGFGVDFLNFNFKTFKQQSFQDFEVVISDHSQNEEIENLCKKTNLNINYLKNKENIGNSSANINNSIKQAKGKWIKILFQDDFLYGKNALSDLHQHIIQNFNVYSENYDENGFITENNLDDSGWVVTSSEHTTDGYYLLNPYEPRWSLEAIYKGHNTISSPSVLSFKNEYQNNLLFDINLNWLMDIDYYYKLFLKYGEPSIMKKINAVNRVWTGSESAKMTQEIINKELEYFKNKININ